MMLPPSRYCAPGWKQGRGTCFAPAALQRSMRVMSNRMLTAAGTPVLFGQPANGGLFGEGSDEEATTEVSTAGVTTGAGGAYLSWAIQGGMMGLIASLVFVPKKVVAVASITALVGGLIGAAASGRPRPQ